MPPDLVMWRLNNSDLQLRCIDKHAARDTARPEARFFLSSPSMALGTKTVRIFSDRIRDRIRLEEF
jgi:hypothetical protein